MYHMFFSASILFLILIFIIIYFHCWFLGKSSRRRWLAAVLSQLLSQHRTSDCLTIKKTAIIKLSNTVCELECQSFYFGYFSCTKKTPQTVTFLVPSIFQWDFLILKLTFSILYSYHCNNFFIFKHFINNNIIFYNQLPIPFKSIKSIFSFRPSIWLFFQT